MGVPVSKNAMPYVVVGAPLFVVSVLLLILGGVLWSGNSDRDEAWVQSQTTFEKANHKGEELERELRRIDQYHTDAVRLVRVGQVLVVVSIFAFAGGVLVFRRMLRRGAPFRVR
jgi:hypothetical protein